MFPLEGKDALGFEAVLLLVADMERIDASERVDMAENYGLIVFVGGSIPAPVIKWFVLKVACDVLQCVL